jgi:hypothetical protein
VTFNSDKPLECMTLYYDKDPNQTFNYFSCKTCNSNCIFIEYLIDFLRDLRELPRRMPQGACAPTASDESQTDLGLLLLHEEGSVLVSKFD